MFPALVEDQRKEARRLPPSRRRRRHADSELSAGRNQTRECDLVHFCSSDSAKAAKIVEGPTGTFSKLPPLFLFFCRTSLSRRRRSDPPTPCEILIFPPAEVRTLKRSVPSAVFIDRASCSLLKHAADEGGSNPTSSSDLLSMLGGNGGTGVWGLGGVTLRVQQGREG